MKYFLFGFLLFFALKYQHSCNAVSFITVPLIVKSVREMYKNMKIVPNLFINGKDTDEVSPDTARVLNTLDSMSSDYQDMKDKILDNISDNLIDKVTARTDQLFEYVKDIQHDYERFLKILKNEYNLEKSVIEKFAQDITNSEITPSNSKSRKIYNVFDSDFKFEDLIMLIAQKNTAINYMCERRQSTQLMLLDLLKLVIITQTKALMMTLYCYDLRETFENTTYFGIKNLTITEFQDSITLLRSSTLETVSYASREVWRCDPNDKKHIQGWTYVKFDGILQTYFLYQTDVSTHWEYSAFVLSCSKYKDERLYCHSYPCQTQPTERRCYGHLRDCYFLERSLQICHSFEGSDKRYDWMKTQSGLTYGHYNGECSWYTQGLTSATTVDTCICTCESDSRKIKRYISLREETSDVLDNKVVTGVKFVMKDNVLFLQVQQGTLGMEATIIDEPEWKPVKEFTMNELYWEKISTEHKVGSDKWTEFYPNNMVYTITYKNHTILLDDLNVKPGHLVTGVRFANYYNSLLLLVQETPFQYTSGSLYHVESKWIKNLKDKKKRQKVILTEPDDPIRTSKSEIYSHGEKYVELRMSDMKRDLGQNVIPYFDAQEVTLNPPLPLQGIGIFHKGRKNFGGFIAPKIMHYDLTQERDIPFEEKEVKNNIKENIEGNEDDIETNRENWTDDDDI